jgi:hypothetical protein
MAAVLCPLRRQCCGMEKQVMATGGHPLPPPSLPLLHLALLSLPHPLMVHTLQEDGCSTKGLCSLA